MGKFNIEPVGILARLLNLIDRFKNSVYMGFNTSGYHGIIKAILSTKEVAKLYLLGVGYVMSF